MGKILEHKSGDLGLDAQHSQKNQMWGHVPGQWGSSLASHASHINEKTLKCFSVLCCTLTFLSFSFLRCHSFHRIIRLALA